MSAHGPRHEEILRDIVAGDRAEDDPAAQEVLGMCSECRERLPELREVARSLDAAAAEERAARAAAEALPPGAAPGEERVGEILRAAAQRSAASGTGTMRAEVSPATPRPPFARLAAAVLIVAGVAALAAIALRALGDRDPTPGPGPILDGDTVEALAPVGTVDSFELFEWDAEMPPLGWFVVTVRRAGAPETERPLVVTPPIEETRWRPAPDVWRTWPREIEWHVQMFDAEGESRGTSQRLAATRRGG